MCDHTLTAWLRPKSGGPIGHMAVKGHFDWLLGQVPSCQLKDVFVCRHVFVPSTCGITVLKDTTLVSTLGVVGTYGRSPKCERVFLGSRVLGLE